MQQRLFYKDDPGEFENFNIASEIEVLPEGENDQTKKIKKNQPFNNGFLKRREFFINNNEVETISNINIDIFNTNKNLIPGVNFKLVFTKSKNSFSLIHLRKNIELN